MGQLQQVFEAIYEERLEYTKLQAGLVWVAKAGKLDGVGRKKQVGATDIKKLKELGLLEVK